MLAGSRLWVPQSAGSTTYDTYMTSLSPTGWLKLNDASGASAAVDSSGHGHAGTTINNSTFAQTSTMVPGDTSALIGGTMGSYGASRIETAYEVPGGTTNFTANTWFYVPSVSGSTYYPRVLSSEVGYSQATGFSIQVTLQASGGAIIQTSLCNGSTEVGIDSGTGGAGNAGVGWHMATLVYNGSTLSAYIDAVSMGTPVSVTPSWGTGNVTVGNCSGGGNDYISNIMEAAWWTGTALTSTQISSLYALGNAVGSTGVPSSLGSGWAEIWNDYFPGTSLDLTKWTNAEFWDTTDAGNIVVNNGLTLITPSLGSTSRVWSDNTPGTGFGLSDGYAMAVGDYIEIDAIMPGSGVTPYSWATLWVATANVSGANYFEVDIIEGGLGAASGAYAVNYHYGDNGFGSNNAVNDLYTYGSVPTVRHRYGFYRGTGTNGYQTFLDGVQTAEWTKLDTGATAGIVLTTGAPGSDNYNPVNIVGSASNLYVYSARAFRQ